MVADHILYALLGVIAGVFLGRWATLQHAKAEILPLASKETARSAKSAEMVRDLWALDPQSTGKKTTEIIVRHLGIEAPKFPPVDEIDFNRLPGLSLQKQAVAVGAAVRIDEIVSGQFLDEAVGYHSNTTDYRLSEKALRDMIGCRSAETILLSYLGKIGTRYLWLGYRVPDAKLLFGLLAKADISSSEAIHNAVADWNRIIASESHKAREPLWTQLREARKDVRRDLFDDL